MKQSICNSRSEMAYVCTRPPVDSLTKVSSEKPTVNIINVLMPCTACTRHSMIYFIVWFSFQVRINIQIWNMRSIFFTISFQFWCKMDITTIATILLNSTNLAAANLSAMSTLAPQTMPITTSAITSSPFLVTSFSHKTLHSLGKGSFNSKPHIKDFSPITLSTDWSSMARLLVLACLSVIGSIGNVFMISSVMIEDHLKKAGECHHFF